MDFGENFEKSSMQPELPLAAMFGGFWVWFYSFVCKSKDHVSSTSGFTILSKKPSEVFEGGKKRNKREAKG